MHIWASFWTLIWFAGIAIFTGLTVVVAVFGARDLLALLRSLKSHHAEQVQPDSNDA